ncbi:hypothetical protein PR048_015046 [Dryococelus australis]|uniref:Uncharacterized protein n=1 Tax=Dryococelus australis TaxID=614101 RepID=A0ABQ9HGD3_9NEOP|nr:hypothetical protein PR048_015046 [Dryococelus australis]
MAAGMPDGIPARAPGHVEACTRTKYGCRGNYMPVVGFPIGQFLKYRRPPVAQSVGAPTVWGAGGSGFESQCVYGKNHGPFKNADVCADLGVVMHVESLWLRCVFTGTSSASGTSASLFLSFPSLADIRKPVGELQQGQPSNWTGVDDISVHRLVAAGREHTSDTTLTDVLAVHERRRPAKSFLIRPPHFFHTSEIIIRVNDNENLQKSYDKHKKECELRSGQNKWTKIDLKEECALQPTLTCTSCSAYTNWRRLTILLQTSDHMHALIKKQKKHVLTESAKKTESPFAINEMDTADKYNLKQLTHELTPASSQATGISATEKRDLLFLCEAKYIKPQYHDIGAFASVDLYFGDDFRISLKWGAENLELRGCSRNLEHVLLPFWACPWVQKLLYLEPDLSGGSWIVTYTGAGTLAENGYEICYGNGYRVGPALLSPGIAGSVACMPIRRLSNEVPPRSQEQCGNHRFSCVLLVLGGIGRMTALTWKRPYAALFGTLQLASSLQLAYKGEAKHRIRPRGTRVTAYKCHRVLEDRKIRKYAPKRWYEKELLELKRKWKWSKMLKYKPIWSNAGMKGRGKREIPKKICRPAASSGTIPMRKSQSDPGRGLNPVAMVGGEQDNRSATAAPH